MSPFREQPHIELGPLDVGLEAIAGRAAHAVPRGGRIVAIATHTPVPYTTGALGSAGLLIVGFAGALGASTAWRPQSPADLVLCAILVLLGGVSLAAVFRVTDRALPCATRRGEVVGRAARRVLLRLARLAALARKSPSDLDERKIRELRRVLAALSQPDLARWIPADLRGRGELLLARALALRSGAKLGVNVALREEISSLLAEASRHLADPAPAESDLALLTEATPQQTAKRLSLPPISMTGDIEAEEESIALESSEPPARRNYVEVR